ncbi:MAG: ATP-binding protein [Turicibacter sp.]|nr:ATP-binding protein [Turicibacter sp.]
MKFLGKLSIKKKLYLIFATIMLLQTLFVLVGILRINDIMRTSYDFLRNATIRQERIGEVIVELNNIRMFSVLAGYLPYIDVMPDIVIRSKENVNNSIESFSTQLALYIASLEVDSHMPEDYLETKIYLIRQIYESFNYVYTPYIASLLTAINQQNTAQILEFVNATYPIGEVLYGKLWDLRNLELVSAQSIVSRIDAESHGIINLIILLTLGNVAISISLVHWVVKTVRIPVNQLKTALSEVKRGNLIYPIRLNTKDEFGMLSHDIADMVDSISNLNKAATVADYLDTMICVTDFEHRIVYMNKQFAETYDIDREEFIGKKCSDETDNGYNFCPACAHSKLETKDPYIFHDFEYIWDERIDRWITGRGVVVKWPNGQWVYFTCFNDATKLKQNMEEKTEYEIKLKESLLEAESGSVAKSAFIANTSHELRTPIHNILGFAELALENEMPSQVRDYLKKIIKNSNGLLDIVNDVIDISNIESGKLFLTEETFDIKDMLNKCRAIMSPYAVAKNLILHFYNEPFLEKHLIGDFSRLTQVCINLLSNAIKFTEYGAVKCAVTLVEETEETASLYFEFKDSGIGIAEDQISQIFKPFSQVDNSITKKNSGIGLGLSISKKIVESMGGHLKLETSVGLGSKFSFTLKFNTISKELVKKDYKADENEKIPRPNFGKGEVLVVEDNSMNQEVLSEYLKRVGLKFRIANNGSDAIQILRERIIRDEPMFDLVLMDIHMPQMDGLEAASIISGWKTGVPIVAMTANSFASTETYEASGMSDFISKPLNSQELWRILINYFTPLEEPEEQQQTTQKNLEKSDTEQPSSSDQEENESNEFFQKILLHFIKNNQDTYEQINTAVSKGDIVLAHRIAHNLKGNAGHIRQSALQTAAKDLEQALKDKTVSSELVTNVKNELDAVLTKFSYMLKDENEETAKEEEEIDLLSSSLSYYEIDVILSEIEPLLRNGNANYVEYVERIKPIPGSTKLLEHMDNFDSVAALSELIRLKTRLESMV